MIFFHAPLLLFFCIYAVRFHVDTTFSKKEKNMSAYYCVACVVFFFQSS